jgi:DNA mismatch repair protein MutS
MLILLDELGRGTSTYDGLAVARAVIEYIHNHPQLHSRTLFATHYHELTELEKLLPRLKNFRVEIAEEGTELRFLFKIRPGVAEKSYGVYAAKLAGLPRPVVRRAAKLLSEYESQGLNVAGHLLRDEQAEQLRASASPRQWQALLAHALSDIDPDALSPVEALMKLYELKRLAEEEKSGGVRAIKTA